MAKSADVPAFELPSNLLREETLQTADLLEEAQYRYRLQAPLIRQILDGAQVPEKDRWPLYLPLDWGQKPATKLLITSELLDTLAARKGELSAQEVLSIASGSARGTLRNWQTDLNALNEAYYGNSLAFQTGNSPANFFVCGSGFQRALGGYLQQQVRGKTCVELIELASGRVERDWPTIAACLPETVRKLEVTVSDFKPHNTTDHFYGRPGNRHIVRDFDTYSLLEPYRGERRYDFALATYAFDSVYFPGDVYFYKHNGRIFQHHTRLKVPDAHPRWQETKDAFRARDYSNLSLKDLHLVVIEEAWMPVSKLPLQDYLKPPAAADAVALSYAAGAIDRITSLMYSLLKPYGQLIVGEIGSQRKPWETRPPSSRADKWPAAKNDPPFGRTGAAGVFKFDNYHVIAVELRERGFEVDIMGVNDFIISHDPKKKIDGDVGPETLVMIVRRNF